MAGSPALLNAGDPHWNAGYPIHHFITSGNAKARIVDQECTSHLTPLTSHLTPHNLYKGGPKGCGTVALVTKSCGTAKKNKMLTMQST